jgi:large-conductance mechanosensitive channel
MKDFLNNSRNYIIEAITEVKIISKLLLLNSLNFLIINLKDFIKFLLEKNILQTGIGLLIASQVGKLTTAVTEFIITPILEKINIFYDGKFENLTYTIIGIDFKIGQFLLIIIQLLLTLICVYFLWKLTLNANINSIDQLINPVKIE